jgi:hypothetical protein
MLKRETSGMELIYHKMVKIASSQSFGYTNESVVYPSGYGIKRLIFKAEEPSGRISHGGRQDQSGSQITAAGPRAGSCPYLVRS